MYKQQIMAQVEGKPIYNFSQKKLEKAILNHRLESMRRWSERSVFKARDPSSACPSNLSKSPITPHLSPCHTKVASIPLPWLRTWSSQHSSGWTYQEIKSKINSYTRQTNISGEEVSLNPHTRPTPLVTKPTVTWPPCWWMSQQESVALPLPWGWWWHQGLLVPTPCLLSLAAGNLEVDAECKWMWQPPVICSLSELREGRMESLECRTLTSNNWRGGGKIYMA